MSFTLTIDLRDFDRVQNRILQFVANESMRIIGPIAIDDIREKSAQGKDANNSTFDPYTDDYAKWRAKNNLPTSPVTLRVKDQNSILDNLDFDVKTGRVGVPEKLEGQAEGLQEKRDFMNSGPDTVKKIESGLAKGITKLT